MVQVHTLNRGTILVLAIDYTCGYCGNMTLHDGLNDGLFCVNENNMFTPELLVMCVWDFCNSGVISHYAHYS